MVESKQTKSSNFDYQLSQATAGVDELDLTTRKSMGDDHMTGMVLKSLA
jgi:hypothetical protein